MHQYKILNYYFYKLIYHICYYLYKNTNHNVCVSIYSCIREEIEEEQGQGRGRAMSAPDEQV